MAPEVNVENRQWASLNCQYGVQNGLPALARDKSVNSLTAFTSLEVGD